MEKNIDRDVEEVSLLSLFDDPVATGLDDEEAAAAGSEKDDDGDKDENETDDREDEEVFFNGDATSLYFRDLRLPQYQPLAPEKFFDLARELGPWKVKVKDLAIELVCRSVFERLCPEWSGDHSKKKCPACRTSQIFIGRFEVPASLAGLAEWSELAVNGRDLLALFKFFRLNSAEQIIRRMCETNQRLVVSIAKHSRWHRSKRFPILELIQSGNIGLITAAARFNPELGYQFSTFATWHINQSIDRECMNTVGMIRIPINVAELYGQISMIVHDLGLDIDDDGAAKKIAAKLTDDPSRLAYWTDQVGKASAAIEEVQDSLSLDRELTDEGFSLLDIVPDQTIPSAEAMIEVNERKRLLAVARNKFLRGDSESGKMMWRVLSLRRGLNGTEPQSIKQVADQMNITLDKVRRYETRALAKLREAIACDPV